MLETVIALLVILWLLGLGSSYTMGGLNVLLVVAVVMLLLRLFPGRRLA